MDENNNDHGYLIELSPTVDTEPEAKAGCCADSGPLTEEEAVLGEVVYHDIDDLDDNSNGVVDEEVDDEVIQGFMLDPRQTALQRARIIRECLIRHGVPEVSIELQEGRPTSGDRWNACRPVAVMSHHIVSRYSKDRPTPGLWLVKNGRSDLPGPLSNGYGGFDLVYRILTLGLANHSGFGGSYTITGPMGSYAIPKDVGRPYIWGTEYEGGLAEADWDRKYTNKRTGKTMTFREFMGRANAGLTEAIWLINNLGKRPGRNQVLASYHMEHKTWAGNRKIDRLGYTTEYGRVECRKYQKDGPKKVYYPNLRRAAEGKIKKKISAVARVQRALRTKGYGDDIKITGLWDRPTKKAWRKYESSLKKNNDDRLPGVHEVRKLVEPRYRLTGIDK